MYKKIDFSAPFDPVMGTRIILVPGHLFYRGYETKWGAVCKWPSHYGTYETASGYGTLPGRTTGAFTNTKGLRLYDFRYMRFMLERLFENRKDNEETTLDPIVRVSLGYGMCSLADQVSLALKMFPLSPGTKALQEYYNTHIRGKPYIEMPTNVHPITAPGVRIAETQNDAYILQFLKEVFGDHVDGFIAPRLRSEYHVEKEGYMSAEMVLFDPLKSMIEVLPDMPPQADCVTLTMTQILETQSYLRPIEFRDLSSAIRTPKYIIQDVDTDTFFAETVKSDADAKELLQKAKRSGKAWKKGIRIMEYYTPHPCSEVFPWNS